MENCIIVYLLLISVHGEANYKTSYSPVNYQSKEVCELEADNINKIAYNHLNVRCIGTKRDK